MTDGGQGEKFTRRQGVQLDPVIAGLKVVRRLVLVLALGLAGNFADEDEDEDDRGVAEKILRHLGVWHDPPPVMSTPAGARNYTRVPFDDVDPMPDYDNVLTD